MSNKKKFFMIFIFILLDVFLLVGFLVIRDATMLNELKNEVDDLSKLDFTHDRYNLKMKTKGKYRIVEEAIKDYLDNYAVSLQSVLDIVHNPYLTKILSYDNYQKDGPMFTESLAFLKEKRESFMIQMEQLLKNSEEDTIKGYIYNRIDDSYYCDLYQELILNDTLKADFQEMRELLENTNTRMNTIFDTSKEVLEFLVTHKEEWVLEEGEIRFQTDVLYNQYLKYIEKVS
jgi:hypothetical protein